MCLLRMYWMLFLGTQLGGGNDGVKIETGSFIGSTSLQTIKLEKTPKVVIIYNEYNNTDDGVASWNVSGGNVNWYARIYTQDYKTSKVGCIIENGFTFKGKESNTKQFYIAFF